MWPSPTRAWKWRRLPAACPPPSRLSPSGGPEGPPLRTRQQRDQLFIRGWKAEVAQTGTRDPAHLLTELRLRCAQQIASIEVQRDVTVDVPVRRGCNDGADRHVCPELLLHLAAQRLRVA